MAKAILKPTLLVLARNATKEINLVDS